VDHQLEAVGRQIRKLREDHGLSQEDFAAKAGLDRAYYGAVERGKRNLSARNLIKIAVALNVNVGALFPPISDLR
jgi:transcriptional regulator with XRE-family HTH domain